MSTKGIDRPVLNLKQDKDEPNSELVTKEEIKDSPFTIIGTEGKYFGAIGKYRITEPVDNKEEIRKDLKKITWNRIVQVMLILTEVQK